MSGHSLQLVLVDDDEMTLEIVQRRLRGFTCHANYFSSPLLGLDYLKTHSPDVLIVDQRMPHLTGVQLLAEIDLKTITQTYVASSGPLPEAIKDEVRALGAIPLQKDAITTKDSLATLIGLPLT